MVEQLNRKDIEYIHELNRGGNRRRIPSPHAEKLLELGIAKLEMGHLNLSCTGRRIARSLTR
ncbi:MAG: hypothetical protein D6754_08670 [Alphaproteobacteria bacterium]|nr:MAG: hypothetical protein D6754_08670 [Alphaproteobacteria bacterium]